MVYTPPIFLLSLIFKVNTLNRQSSLDNNVPRLLNMMVLEAIKNFSERGYKNIRVVDLSLFRGWHIVNHEIIIYSVDAVIMLEIENGDEYTLKAGSSKKIDSNIFFNLYSDHKYAKILLASPEYRRLYGT